MLTVANLTEYAQSPEYSIERRLPWEFRAGSPERPWPFLDDANMTAHVVWDNTARAGQHTTFLFMFPSVMVDDHPLDKWIETAFAFPPKRTREVYGRIVRRATAEFATAFADELTG